MKKQKPGVVTVVTLFALGLYALPVAAQGDVSGAVTLDCSTNPDTVLIENTGVVDLYVAGDVLAPGVSTRYESADDGDTDLVIIRTGPGDSGADISVDASCGEGRIPFALPPGSDPAEMPNTGGGGLSGSGSLAAPISTGLISLLVCASIALWKRNRRTIGRDEQGH